MNHLQPTNNELTKWDPSPRPINYQPETSISDIWRILVKRKFPILAFALLGLALSASYIHLKTPIYQATAAVQIDPSRVTTLGLTDSNQGGYTDEDELLQTDIEILGSCPNPGFSACGRSRIVCFYPERAVGRPSPVSALIGARVVSPHCPILRQALSKLSRFRK